jgi:hypothetical protein
MQVVAKRFIFQLGFLCTIGLYGLLHSASATAAVIQVERDDFDPKATTFDFDTVPCGLWTAMIPRTTVENGDIPQTPEVLDIIAPSFPAPPGCNFWGPPNNPTSAPGRNAAFVQGGLRLTFADPLLRVGFVWGANIPTSNDFDVIRNNQVVDTFTLVSNPGPPDGVNNWIFYGFEDPLGIDEIFFRVFPNPVPTAPILYGGIYDLILEPITIIDIKPGKAPNKINLCAKGHLSVTVFGSEVLDVHSDVDPETVQFAGAGVKRDKNGDPIIGSKDVDRDGHTDVVLNFEIPDLGLESGDEEAELTGQTFGSTPIQGAIAIEVKQQMCVRTTE